MKTLLMRSLIICLLGLSSAFISLGQRPFIITWETTENDEEIIIPTKGDGYNYDIYWESMEDNSINGELTNQTGDATITLEEPGTYRVSISGDFPRLFFGGSDYENNVKLRTIEQWGDNEWQSMAGAFWYCHNVTFTAEDSPDLSNVTDMSRMFERLRNFNEEIGHWDVSNVTDMSAMFYRANSFNQNIGDWDVSNVTDMSDMFYIASDFNQNIGGWDVSNVTDMTGMFHIAKSFNQDIGDWDVSNVTQMPTMFNSASDFNQDIGNWSVGNVTNMFSMFYRASSFNQDIGDWDVSNVTNMSNMFYRVSSFNQDIGGWDVSNVTDMSYTFYCLSGSEDIDCHFNQNLGGWDVSNVTDMRGMLSGSSLTTENYDQTLQGWAQQEVQEGVTLGDSGLTYCVAEEARQSLTDEYWSFQDDRKAEDCIATATTSTEKLAIAVYPNPASDQLFIELPQGSSAQLDILDYSGQSVYAAATSGTTERVDVSGFAPGVYIIQLQGEHTTTTHRFVKE